MNSSSDNKCIFIINLLRESKSMTRNEISKRLQMAFPSEVLLPRSSWNRLLTKIYKNTSYHIYYNSKEKAYNIRLKSSVKHSNNNLLDYVFSSYQVMESSQMMMRHADVIYNADVISGTSVLYIILEAIDQSRGLTFTYTSFVNDTRKTRNFIPYFLSSWEGRWYLVAEAETHPGDLYTYALDRMSDIKLSFEKVKRNIKITAEEYFANSYGIQSSKPEDAIDIVIRVFGVEAKYIQSKPIHSSQQEIDVTQEYIDFKLHLAPCYNFYQQLLRHRENLVVISPQSVRSEVKRIAEEILKRY